MSEAENYEKYQDAKNQLESAVKLMSHFGEQLDLDSNAIVDDMNEALGEGFPGYSITEE